MSSKNIIFYFTGTNNSLMAAQIIAAKLGDCQLIALSQFNTMETIEAERVGVVCPVYYWGLPNIVRETVAKLKLKPDTYVYGIITMGSSAGNALPELERILASHSVPNKLSYGACVKCPDNYSTLLGFQKPASQKQLLADARVQLENSSEEIEKRKVNQIPKFKKTTEFLFSSKRKSLRKNAGKYCVGQECIGCGECVRSCPVQNIRMEEGKPVFGQQCEFCLSCISNCRQFAIQIGKKTKGKPRYTNPMVKKT